MMDDEGWIMDSSTWSFRIGPVPFKVLSGANENDDNHYDRDPEETWKFPMHLFVIAALRVLVVLFLAPKVKPWI